MLHSIVFRRAFILELLFLTVLCLYASAQSVELFDSCNLQRQKIQYHTIDSIHDLAWSKPRPFQFVTQTPSDLWQAAKAPFQNENRLGLLITGAATFSFIIMDQPLVDAVQRFAHRNHISAIESNHILWSVKIGGKSTKLLSVPGNFNTALYQLGQGFPSLLLGGGFWIYGKLGHDYRALSTASQLAESFIVMGVGTQILKRIAGRQTPGHATVPGGLWRPFPSFKNFQNHTPEYDAFPSGHLATLMSTVTILAENYPKKKYIKPVGYAVIGLIGLAMMNNGVHWAGDYPLAIALGYVSARIVSAQYRRKVKHRNHDMLMSGY